MLTVIDKKTLVEKEAKLMEELIINYLLNTDDKTFFTNSRIFELSVFYKNIFNKIFIFIAKFSDQHLKSILSSDILNSYDRHNLNEIIKNSVVYNPDEIIQRIYYLNSLIFMRSQIDEAMYNYDLDTNEDICFGTKIKSLVKGFEEKFHYSNKEDSINNTNIEEKYDEIFKKEGKSLVSGIDYLDNITNGGFNSGDLIICAARPGVGKTTFGINLIVNNFDYLQQTNKKVLWVTPDMSPKYLYYRLIACAYDIDINEIFNFDKHTMLSYIKNLPLQVTETYLYEKIVEFIKIYSENIIAVVIDYIQIIRCMSSSIKNIARNEQIGYITIELKRIAKKYGITLFFLAQLNRASEMNSDQKVWIRDSGYLEQEADFILILNQDKTYRYPKILFDVIKNRHGGLGRFHNNLNSSRFRIE